MGEKAFIRTNIVYWCYIKCKTQESHLQARLRNILQEEGVNKPPYILKVISCLEALKDTNPAPVPEIHATRKPGVAKCKYKEDVQASSGACLGESLIKNLFKENKDTGIFCQDA